MDQEFYKKSYTFHEFYITLYNGFRTMKYLNKAKKNKEMNNEFVERIMLAVTEVNGCEVCSYAHAKWALEAGMSNEEIQRLLSGITEGVPAYEAPAIFFAQHYADTKGNPSKESWERVVEVYGEAKANGILGAVREIMIGNVYGIPASAFLSRLKGKPVKKSNFFFETGMILSIILFAPAALLCAGISIWMKKPLINF